MSQFRRQRAQPTVPPGFAANARPKRTQPPGACIACAGRLSVRPRAPLRRGYSRLPGLRARSAGREAGASATCHLQKDGHQVLRHPLGRHRHARPRHVNRVAARRTTRVSARDSDSATGGWLAAARRRGARAATHVQMVLVMPVSAPATNLRSGLRCVSPSAVSHCRERSESGAHARQRRSRRRAAQRVRAGAAARRAARRPAGRARRHRGWAGAACRRATTKKHAWLPASLAAHPRQRLVRGVVDGGVGDDAHHHRACGGPAARRRRQKAGREPAKSRPKGAPRRRRAAGCAAARAPLPFQSPRTPSVDAMATIWLAAALKEKRDLLT